MASADFRRQLEGYGLTTANILYHMPDHPGSAELHLAATRSPSAFSRIEEIPRFLVARAEGLLHSVTVAHARLIRPAEIKTINAEFRLH